MAMANSDTLFVFVDNVRDLQIKVDMNVEKVKHKYNKKL